MESNDAVIASRELALRRCQELIEWYEQTKRRQRQAWQFFQASAVILSGLTPVLILWSELPEVLQALPAALAAMAAGLAGIFQWRESYPRYAYVCEALKSERLKYETRTTTDYGQGVSDYQALNHFIIRMETLVMDEVSDWRTQMQRKSAPEPEI